MAYWKGRGAIDAVRPLLKQLATGAIVKFRTDSPTQLAYQLRQAIAATEFCEDDDTPPVVYKFISALRYIVAVPMDFDKTLERISPTNKLQLIQSLVEAPVTRGTRFPNVNLSPEELESIKQWAEQNHIVLMADVTMGTLVRPLEV